jgi:hypothetical protein
MKEIPVIKDFCIIRNQKIVTGSGIHASFGNLPFSEFLTAAYQHFNIGYPKFYKMDPLCKLGFIASELLLKNKELSGRYESKEVGMVFANASSSLAADKSHQESIRDRAAYFPGPAVFVYTLPNILIGEISIRHKITGEGLFMVGEKFDPGFIHTYVNQLFSENIIKCCIAGWVETDGKNYDSVLYFIEKDQFNDGITIFEPAEMSKIYQQ